MCISSVSFLPQELPGPQEGLRVLELPALEGEGGREKGRRKGWEGGDREGGEGRGERGEGRKRGEEEKGRGGEGDGE